MKRLCCFVLAILIGWSGMKIGNWQANGIALADGGLQLTDVTANATQVGQYEKFELTFNIEDTLATMPELPYDPAPPPGIEPGTGLTVDALFSNDNWTTTLVQPAFLYQDFERSQHNGYDHIYPIGQPVWKARFAPRQAGTWHYRLRARDASGVTYFPTAGDLSFTVVSSNKPGFLHVSPQDSRYFQFDNGQPFTGIGHQDSFEIDQGGVSLSTYVADETLAVLSETRTNLIRTWLSSAAIAGSAWAPWTSHVRGYYGNVPYITLSAEETYHPDGLSLKLTPYDACVFQGFQGGPVPVLPHKTYRLTVRVKTANINRPARQGFPYGFTVKLGGWLGEGDGNNRLLCDDPDQGTALLPHVTNTDWQEVSGTLNTSTNQYFLNNLYLVLDNTREGPDEAREAKVYIDEVRLQEVLPGGQLGPNVVKKGNMNMHTYFDPAPAWQWDYILDQAAAAGVYLKLVILDKDDLLYSRIRPDGAFDPSQADDDNTYAQPDTRVRWLHQAWWRYLIARWGYSPAIHSWELLNEGDPFNANHYNQADALAEMMHQDDPSRHMVTTSFWHSFPVAEFWGNSAVDYADVHAYVSTGEGIYAFWGDDFEEPLRIETSSANTFGGSGWSIRLDGNEPFDFANRMSLPIHGQGEWLIKYWLKAQNLSGTCESGNSLAGPSLFWDLKKDDTVENSNRVPPAPGGDAFGCGTPTGSYDWTQFRSDRLADGTPAPLVARLIVPDNDWHELVLYFRNHATTGGRAWLDEIEITDPQGRPVALNGSFDLTRMDEDAALYTAARSLRQGGASPVGAGKPLIRGEAGLDYPDQQEEQADLAEDTGGVWFHNFVWGQINSGGMIDLYWWNGNIWRYNLHRHVKPFQDFMDGIPLNNGFYVDAEAIPSDPGLRAWGQKDLEHGRAYLWIQNKAHTWRNVVDDVTIRPLGGTISLSGFAPDLYEVTWWDTYDGTLLRTEQVGANDSLVLTLPQPLETDIAVKVRPLASLSPSLKRVDRQEVQVGDILTFTVVVANVGPGMMPDVSVTDPAPTGLTYLPETAWTTAGLLTATAHLVAWSGSVPPEQPIEISFQAQVDPNLDDRFGWIQNEAVIEDSYHILRRTASILVNGQIVDLPVILKHMN